MTGVLRRRGQGLREQYRDFKRRTEHMTDEDLEEYRRWIRLLRLMNHYGAHQAAVLLALLWACVCALGLFGDPTDAGWVIVVTGFVGGLVAALSYIPRDIRVRLWVVYPALACQALGWVPYAIS